MFKTLALRRKTKTMGIDTVLSPKFVALRFRPDPIIFFILNASAPLRCPPAPSDRCGSFRACFNIPSIPKSLDIRMMARFAGRSDRTSE